MISTRILNVLCGADQLKQLSIKTNVSFIWSIWFIKFEPILIYTRF